MQKPNNLKDINSMADLFEYIQNLEKEIEIQDEVINRQIAEIADLQNLEALYQEALRKKTEALKTPPFKVYDSDGKDVTNLDHFFIGIDTSKVYRLDEAGHAQSDSTLTFNIEA